MEPDDVTTTAPATVTLSERESKRRLAVYGVPLVPEDVARTAEDAVAAAERIGYPVALKLCGAGIAHKTERGLVRLDVDNAEAVRRAAEELLAAATPEDGEVELLVAAMARGQRELIAGVVRDRQFGPCVMVGVGGVLAEALQDVVLRLAPIDAVDAAEMLEDLRTQALLGPFRGEPAVDRDAVAGVLLGLSALVSDDDRVVSVDVNPLVIVDGRPVAVDALVEVEA